MNNDLGVFETLRTYRGHLSEVKAHLHRLRTGARLIRIPVPLSDKQLAQLLTSHCRTSGETRLKIIITRNHIITESRPLHISRKIYTTGVGVMVYRGARQLPQVKSTNRTLEDRANNLAITYGYFDALLLNQHGTVPEAACGNIFYVKKNVVYTPNKDILYGITRAVVVQLAKANRINLRYHLPTVADLRAADELFLTRSGMGIVPVVRIKQRKIGNGKPGEVTKRLMKLFAEYANR
ncbi:MAG: hypothetical protein ACD_41C00281G0004 [uncultured bacterium]|nr:MAG: hypothetical protein ACD_41C00281G0004 [uncultured bacterium]HBY73770.1 hypothetical protein [Candidatus Kerfeldbacteria bacterium]